MPYRLSDLRSQIAWFNRLRAVAVVSVVMLTVLATWVLPILEDPVPLLALAAITLLVNLAYAATFPRLATARDTVLRRHVDLQIAVDLVLLTSLLHYSGGVTNPFLLFYLFHTFIASLLRSVRAALVVAAISTVLVGTLAFAEYAGVLPRHPLRMALFDLEQAPALAVAALVAAFGATLFISVYFLANILQLLTRREEELGGLRRQLGRSERLAALGTLAAGVAHEINNPISVIGSRVQILRHRIADGDDAATLLREFDTIDRHVERIGNITGGLLQFSKDSPFELRPLRVNEVAYEAAEFVAAPFRAAALDLRLELADSDPQTLGSRHHLMQVLVNMLLNARDASAAGSEVVIRTEARPREAWIEVRDRGTGIATAHLDQIFDPFFTTKDVDKGTGLGLAISHGIVERHGGRILVESEPGRGTLFRIVLPSG